MGQGQYGRYKGKPKNARYWNRNQRARNKMRRIEKSSGLKEARRWAAAHGVLGLLNESARG